MGDLLVEVFFIPIAMICFSFMVDLDFVLNALWFNDGGRFDTS